MPSLRAGLVLLVAAAHLGAATLPCPAPEAGGAPTAEDGPSAHAVDDHDPGSPHGAGPSAHEVHPAHAETRDATPEADTEMAARCPCGCGGVAPGAGVVGRLGPALLRAVPAPASPPCARGTAAAAPSLPDAPSRTPDPVPI